MLQRHLLPVFGAVPIIRLHRAQFKDFLATKLAADTSREYVKLILSVLHIVLEAAQDDEVIVVNPAGKLRKAFKLSRQPSCRTRSRP